MKNIFKFGKDKDQKDFKDDVNKPVNEEKAKKETLVYGIIFCIILIVALIARFTSNNDNTKTDDNTSTNETVSTNEGTDLLSDLDKNNFDAELTIIADTDLLNLLIRREAVTKELISKTYRDESQVYYINGNKIYKAVNNSFVIDTNSNIYNDYDATFLNIENLKELVDKSTYDLNLTEEEYNIKRYKVEASRVIDIYNDYNKTTIKKRVSGEVILDIYYDDESLIGLKLDLTNLYENLDYDYRKVIYNYEFDNFGKIDIASFMEVPAE